MRLYVLFDFWRTLIDPPEDLTKFYRHRIAQILEVEGIEDSDFITRSTRMYMDLLDVINRIRRTKFVEIPAEYEIKLFLSSIGIDDLRDEHLEAYASPMLELTKLKRGAHMVLSYLREKGCKLAIVSNTPYHQMVVNKMKKDGIFDFFDAVVTSHKVGIRKPCERIFNYALEVLGGRVDEAVMIGDTPFQDILGAKKIGMKALWMYREADEEPYLVDGIIRGLEEIPKLLKEIAGL